MNDEVKDLSRQIEKMICPECNRIEVDCRTCPVQKLADKFRPVETEYVTRTLISRQQFEYLCDVGVVSCSSGSSDLVIYPYDMEHCSLLDGDMKNDLLKEAPWSVRFNRKSHESPDIRVSWCIPQWLFMENQKDVLKTYFGRG